MLAWAALLLLAAPDTPWTRAIALFEKRDFAAAEQAFRRIPGRAAQLSVARAAIEQRHYADAVAAIEQALAGQPDPETRFRAGEILRELAEHRLAALERSAPNSAGVWEMAGANLERSGRRDEALRAYRTALLREPDRSGIHYHIGNLLWRDRDLPGALQELRLELDRNQHHGMANLRLGQVLLAQDAASEAITPLERAIGAMPHAAEARKELGKAYRKTERLSDARQQWELVARMNPQDTQIHFLLGGLYRDLGLKAEAKREFERHSAILARRAAASGRLPAEAAPARPPAQVK